MIGKELGKTQDTDPIVASLEFAQCIERLNLLLKEWAQTMWENDVAVYGYEAIGL